MNHVEETKERKEIFDKDPYELSRKQMRDPWTLHAMIIQCGLMGWVDEYTGRFVGFRSWFLSQESLERMFWEKSSWPEGEWHLNLNCVHVYYEIKNN